MAKKKKVAAAELPKDKPPVGPDDITVIYSKSDAVSLEQLLTFCKNVFAQSALEAQKTGNEQEAEVMQSRAMISNALLEKLIHTALIGEPESRNVH